MAFCKNCGSPIKEGSGFCGNCGASVGANAAGGYQQGGYQQGGYQQGGYQAGGFSLKSSTWDGGVLDTIVNSIVASLIISVTCGIATPWAICYMMKFVVEHAIIDGKRLKFDGTGGQLFGNWIKWLLLTVITCGIYSFWVTPRLYQWITSHIHTEG